VCPIKILNSHIQYGVASLRVGQLQYTHGGSKEDQLHFNLVRFVIIFYYFEHEY
jgi:hypothetical protein